MSLHLFAISPVLILTMFEVIPISSHQDTVGPMTRSVEDGAIILSIIAGRDSKDNYTQTAPATIPDYTKYLDAGAIKGKRFGVPRAAFTNDTVSGNDPYINVAFNKSLETIKALGGIVVDPVDFPSAYEIATSGDEWLVLNIDFKVRHADLKLGRYLLSVNIRLISTHT